MSIKQEAYDVCKIIKDLNIRAQVQEIINELNRVSEEDRNTEKDRSYFGNIAKKQRAQFLGYLVVDQQRKKIEKDSPLKVPEITTSEREILEKAHYIIKYVNKKITHSIIKKIPNLKETLDVYSHFPYSDVSMDIAEIVENPNIFDNLIEAVTNCNVYIYIDSTPIDFLNSIPSNRYLDSVLSFIWRLDQLGVHDTPEDFKETNFSKGSSEYVLTKLFYSLMSFRKILSNINQLIYQAFLTDKLVIINEDNIINILKNNTHMTGRGLTLLVQPLRRELFVNLGDLILVKQKLYNLDELCVVKGINITFNQELGNQMKFKMRIVNDELNPYFGLIQNI